MLYLCRVKTSLPCLLCIRPYSLSSTTTRGFHLKNFTLSWEWWLTPVSLECAWYVQGSWFEFQYPKEEGEKGNEEGRDGEEAKAETRSICQVRWPLFAISSYKVRWEVFCKFVLSLGYIQNSRLIYTPDYISISDKTMIPSPAKTKTRSWIFHLLPYGL